MLSLLLCSEALLLCFSFVHYKEKQRNCFCFVYGVSGFFNLHRVHKREAVPLLRCYSASLLYTLSVKKPSFCISYIYEKPLVSRSLDIFFFWVSRSLDISREFAMRVFGVQIASQLDGKYLTIS